MIFQKYIRLGRDSESTRVVAARFLEWCGIIAIPMGLRRLRSLFTVFSIVTLLAMNSLSAQDWFSEKSGLSTVLREQQNYEKTGNLLALSNLCDYVGSERYGAKAAAALRGIKRPIDEVLIVNEVLPTLWNGLIGKSPYVQRECAISIQKFDKYATNMVDDLISALEMPISEESKRWLIRTISVADSGSKKSVASLLRIVVTNNGESELDDLSLKVEAASAIAALGCDPLCVAALKGELNSANRYVSVASAIAVLSSAGNNKEAESVLTQVFAEETNDHHLLRFTLIRINRYIVASSVMIKAIEHEADTWPAELKILAQKIIAKSGSRTLPPNGK